MASLRQCFQRKLNIFAVISGSIFAIGQKPHACHIDYEDQNQIDYEIPSRVGVMGFVTDPSSAPVPNICVAVFTEKGHRFILGRTSDSKGQFHLPLLKDGQYRLVVQAEGLGVANAKFRKIPEDFADQPLHVHLLVRGIDTTSFIDTK